MLKTLLWIAVMSLLAVWSLLGWAAYAVASWSGWGSGSTIALPAWIDSWTPPPWAAPWFPAGSLDAVKGLFSAWAPLIDSSLPIVQGVAAWLPPIVVALWTVGVLVVLGLGILGTVLLRLLRGNARRAPEAD